MTYLLDTDHVSVLERPGGTGYVPLVANLNLHAADGIGTPVVGFHEQALGAHDEINQARTPAQVVRGYEHLLRAIELYQRFPLIPFDAAAAAVFSVLRSQRVRIGTMDLRIAATALSRGLTVVTRNTRDFSQVPGLRLEDWTK